jgi:hypothetical protein
MFEGRPRWRVRAIFERWVDAPEQPAKWTKGVA